MEANIIFIIMVIIQFFVHRVLFYFFQHYGRKVVKLLHFYNCLKHDVGYSWNVKIINSFKLQCLKVFYNFSMCSLFLGIIAFLYIIIYTRISIHI